MRKLSGHVLRTIGAAALMAVAGASVARADEQLVARVVDLVEAVLLQGREGERFDAVVIDDDLLQLRDPAVRAKLDAGCPKLGSEVSVTLESADPATRTVRFALA